MTNFMLTGSAAAQGTACGITNPLFALSTDNTIYALRNGKFSASRVNGIDGNLIGIDFRVSDGPTGRLYGLTDTGKLYQIGVDPFVTIPPFLISTLAPRFAGGFQSLADFNPVLTPTANALRLIGSNDQNFAVVDGGGTLSTTAMQTPVAYVQGDVSFGVDANLTAGAYDNNAAGATFTTFYSIDYDLDTLVTIADRNPSGSSNTGAGKLRTIGPIVDAQGRRINFAPNAGLDVFTQASAGGLVNRAVAVSGRTFYCIDLSPINPSTPPGTQQAVVATPVSGAVANPVSAGIVSGGFIDVAVSPFAAPVLKANAGPDTFFETYFVGVVDACQSTGNIASYTFEQVSYTSSIYPNVVSRVMTPFVSGTNVSAGFVQTLATPFTTSKCAILVEGYDPGDVLTMRVTVRDAAGNASSDDVVLRGNLNFSVSPVVIANISHF